MCVDLEFRIEHPGGGIYIKGSHGMETDLQVTFQFSVTNNVVEYKALVVRLKMAAKEGLRWIIIHSDS